uniref:Anti-proliferative protein domain-containing protein n=1 Tax=Plectus sambesii TaxID=2011161 RepID=A0A914XLU4_9BILA
MYVEIQEAVCFLCSFLYDKIPRRRVDMFAERLANLLYSGYADDRQAVDEGSRRVDVKVRGHTDRLILLAADMVQLDKEELLAFLPSSSPNSLT